MCCAGASLEVTPACSTRPPGDSGVATTGCGRPSVCLALQVGRPGLIVGHLDRVTNPDLAERRPGAPGPVPTDGARRDRRPPRALSLRSIDGGGRWHSIPRARTVALDPAT